MLSNKIFKINLKMNVVQWLRHELYNWKIMIRFDSKNNLFYFLQKL